MAGSFLEGTRCWVVLSGNSITSFTCWGRVQAKDSIILWMDEILHHFETMRNQCLLVTSEES